MASAIEKLTKHGVLALDPNVGTVIHEVITGSEAYGMSGGSSDQDVIAVTIPPAEIVFPHMLGRVAGFGVAPPNFEVQQVHHLSLHDKQYDISAYSIVKFFQLAMENNPNILDVLFSPQRCILYTTQIGALIVENRHLFVHKGLMYKFMGYAAAQEKRLRSGGRPHLVEKYGFDTKYASHIVRLSLQCEQFMTSGTVNLEANSEILKAIRAGEWTLQRCIDFRLSKEKEMLELYNSDKCPLPYSPEFTKLNDLLKKCLELQYGSMQKYEVSDEERVMIQRYKEIEAIVKR